MATTILGLFRSVESAAGALEEAAAAGFHPKDLSAISSVPFPEGTLRVHPERGGLPWITFGAAWLGIAIGFSLAAGTALLYPLPTGGKPIVFLPAVGIVTFEAMMLCALAATVVGALFQMKLAPIKRKAYSPLVSDGQVGVLIRCLDEQAALRAEAILSRWGAQEIERYPGDAL